MMPSPIAADAQRCSTPRAPFTSGTATIPTPSQVTRPRSFSGIAVSMRVRMISGGTNVSPEITRIVASTTASLPLYGAP